MESLLKTYFGYESFRPKQKEIIESILSDNNTLGVLPTGAGKSICFQLPGLIKDGITIVISPLISLMRDQVDSLNQKGISATYLNSTLSNQEYNQVVNRIKQQQYKFLYVAPERFENEPFVNMIQSLKINLIAFDEAHCISKWGHDFRPSYQNIIPIIERAFPYITKVAMTATATKEVEENIKALLHIDNVHAFTASVKRDNLHLRVDGTYQREQFLVNYLQQHPHSSGIIYVATRADVDKLCHILNEHNIDNVTYHGGMKKKDRQHHQEKFIHNETNVVVATNAFGMGINKPDIRFIIHYNMPGDLESYYQEIGRAGRDGKMSECILLSSPRDINLQQFFIDRSTSTENYKDRMREKLDTMLKYKRTNKCLTSFITKYFNPNEYVTECGHCSSCLSDVRTVNMVKEARYVIKALQEINHPIKTEWIIQFLRGETTENIESYELNSKNLFGVMNMYLTGEVHHVIDELIYRGYIHFNEGKLHNIDKSDSVFNIDRLMTIPFRKHFNEKVDVSTDATPSERLYDELIAIRKSLAQKHNVSEENIFSDATLSEFAKKQPMSKQEMVHIQGVGNYKLKHYCPKFLEAIEAHQNNTDI